MKIFVSSRMRELLFERKIVIETIHEQGHTPLYIETEPEVRDAEAKATMDKMVRDADAFISLSYISFGKPDAILDGQTPIQYELNEFKKYRKGAPVIFLIGDTDPSTRVSEALQNWRELEIQALGAIPIKFKRPEDLEKQLKTALDKFRDQREVPVENRKHVISYMGPDFVGLIGFLAEVAFSSYRLNIDYVSHASTGGSAATYMSCSQRLIPGVATISGSELNAQLEIDLTERIPLELERAKSEGRLPESVGLPSPFIKVKENPLDPPQYQFFAIVRTIDAPGQVNAVCKALRDEKYNIDEFQLRPAAQQFDRQTTMTMWLSKDDGTSARSNLLNELEQIFRYLVGVRNFSVRVIEWPSPVHC